RLGYRMNFIPHWHTQMSNTTRTGRANRYPVRQVDAAGEEACDTRDATCHSIRFMDYRWQPEERSRQHGRHGKKSPETDHHIRLLLPHSKVAAHGATKQVK